MSLDIQFPVPSTVDFKRSGKKNIQAEENILCWFMGVLPRSVFISQPKETRITFPKLVISEMKKKKKKTLRFIQTLERCV